MILRHVAVAGLAVIALSGCQAEPPGAAAVVDGTTISMSRADDAAEVYCRLTLLSAQQQGVSSVSNAEVRRQAVSDLVLARVADRVARERDLQVPTSSYTLSAAQRANVAQAVPGLDEKTAVGVVEAGQRTYVIATLLGEQLAGKPLDASQGTDAFQSAGLDILMKRLRSLDVRYDPRFGLARDSQPGASSTGSLSVGVKAADTAEATDTSLPASQRCA